MGSKEMLRAVLFLLTCFGGITITGQNKAFGDIQDTDFAGPNVTALILVNADTDQDIAIIEEGDVFNLKEIGTSNLNIRAEVSEGTESVVFGYQGNSYYKIENLPVYAIGGDSKSDYDPWLPDIGPNSLNATAYLGDNGTKLSGPPLTVNFEVIEEAIERPAVVRINSGGPEVTFGESFFIADQYFSGNGKPYIQNKIADIFGTTQDEIYLSERSTNASKQSFSYKIPVTNGEYEINLHFAEIYWGASGGGPAGSGKRVFDIKLEGELILSDFDISAEVAPMTALVKTFTTTVTDQSLDLTFTASADQPKLSAIEVFGQGSLLSESEEIIIETLNITNCPTQALYVGDLTANAPGEIIVTVTSLSDGSVSDQCTITILDSVAQVGPSVNALILVNADTDQDIAIIEEGDVFNLEEIGTSNLNIRAEVSEDTESVVFGYQRNSNYKIENLPVYAIGGDSKSDYDPWLPDIGPNSLSATAYLGDNGSSLSGATLIVNFEVLEKESVPGDGNNLSAVVRINSGGPTIAYGDTLYMADEYFEGKGAEFIRSSITEIHGTTQDDLYKSERRATGNLESFTYNIPVSNGDYSVNLHFAETYFGAINGGQGGTGRRVFNVIIEGVNVLMEYDINAVVDPMTAVIETFSTKVTDGSLDILFSASYNQPKVSALEVFGDGQLTFDPTSCSWNTLKPSSLSKTESQSVKINNKLYVLGGFVENLDVTAITEIYDPVTDTWSKGAPMPYPVTHMGAVPVGEEIWILAGFGGDHPGIATDLVQIYNTVTDTWTTGPSLPQPRGSGGAVFSGGKIHYFGGLLPDRVTDVGDHYVINANNIAAGWETLAPLPEPRNHLGAAAVNGILYAIGGQFGHDDGVDDQAFLHAYDPETDKWTEKNDLRSDRSHFEPGTIVHNNKIMIVGGRRGSFIFNDITEYDPQTDTWKELCQLPAKLLAPSAKIIGDQLIVANGGDNGTCCLLDQTISMRVTPEITSEVLRTQTTASQVAINPEKSGSIDTESSMSAGDAFEKSLTIYPNPVNDLLTVKSSSQDPINITLISPTGKVLMEKNDVHQSTFDTSKVKAGMYILIVNNGESFRRFRLVKK